MFLKKGQQVIVRKTIASVDGPHLQIGSIGVVKEVLGERGATITFGLGVDWWIVASSLANGRVEIVEEGVSAPSEEKRDGMFDAGSS